MNHGGGSLDLAMNVTMRLTNLRLEDAQASKDWQKSGEIWTKVHGPFMVDFVNPGPWLLILG